MKKPTPTVKSLNAKTGHSKAGLRMEAFTLVETLVVLLISGLLLGIVYASLRAVEHRYRIFLADSRRQAEISSLRTLLQRDSEQARVLTKVGNSLNAECTGYAVEYVFSDSILIRKQQSVTDTFHLVVDSLSFTWHNRPVPEPTGVVDGVSFLVRNNGETYVFGQQKDYDQKTLWEIERPNAVPASGRRQMQE